MLVASDLSNGGLEYLIIKVMLDLIVSSQGPYWNVSISGTVCLTLCWRGTPVLELHICEFDIRASFQG